MSNPPTTPSEQSPDSDEDSHPTMDDELYDRRMRTFHLLFERREDLSTVVDKLTEEFDVTETAIRTDVGRMDDWIPKLDLGSRASGYLQLLEQRRNRRRYHEMAEQAKTEENLDQELDIRRQIDQSIQIDIQLAQSLGMIDKEPEQVELGWKDYITAAAGSEAVDDEDDDDEAVFVPSSTS